MYFNSLQDFLNANEINDILDFAIVESDDDLSSITSYLTELLESIPDDYYKNFKLSAENILFDSQQKSFLQFEFINKIERFINSSKASFFSSLNVLSRFDFSFINYILPENVNFNPNSKTFIKKNSDGICSYYSNISLFKALLLRHLEAIPSNRKLEAYLYNHTDFCIACGFEPLAIPSHSALNRFKSKLTPLKITAIFYFILTVIVSHNLIDSFLCATDSTHILSASNKYNNITLSDGLNIYYTHSDLNADTGHKTKNFDFFGYKAHVVADSVSRFILAFFVTPASSNDSPLFIPLQKLVCKILSLKFELYAADKGYDSGSNNDFVANELNANPVIAIRNMSKNDVSPHFTFKNGIPYCILTQLPLMPNGNDVKSNCKMFVCPNISKKFDCPYIDVCNPTSKRNIRTLKISLSDVRKDGTLLFPRSSTGFKLAYNKRVVIEQIFSELKAFFLLNNLKDYKLSSIFAHITLSFIAYNLTLFVLK